MRRSLLGLAVLALGVFTALAPAPAVAWQAEAVAEAPDRARERLNARVFDQVWRDVGRHYYDPELNGLDWDEVRETFRPEALAAPDERRLYLVLGRMLAGLEDDHARAAPPAAITNEQLRTVRRPVIGVTLDRAADGYLIRDIRPGTPADEALLDLGWYVETIDGIPFEPDRVLDDGVSVAVALRHPDGRTEVRPLTPRMMDPAPPRRAEWARHDVLVLAIESFDEGLGAWVGAMIAGAPDGARLVLDLRGNSGGRLLEAQNVLSCFLPDGLDWAERTNRNGRERTLTISAGCPPLEGPSDIPLVVLVDQYSTSAAELTPAALQEAGRAVVVGETTAGAVLISGDTDLPDGGRLTLSRSNFLTAGGVRLERRGVIPDVAAVTTIAERRAGRDPALDAAIAALDAGL